MMKGMKKIPQSNAPDALVFRGNLEGLTLLSNGFMRDDRVFHINQPKWIDMYNDQDDSILASLTEVILTKDYSLFRSYGSQGLEF